LGIKKPLNLSGLVQNIFLKLEFIIKS
jgi:hypothetical protein